MTQLNIIKLEKSYGDNQVLENITFSLEYGEKIAIVGTNGCGKSTLLNIIAGAAYGDSGHVYIADKTDIGLLNQNAMQSFDIRYDFNRIDPKYFSYLNLGRDFGTQLKLSGGEITKVALCKLLSQNPDLLLLDEPTNNLDFDGINTLIKLLSTYEGALIIVSHDRYFLDALIHKTIEIDRGVSKEYKGNYSDYRELKNKLFEDSMARYQEDKKRRNQIEESIQQAKQWSEKAHRDSRKKDPSGQKMGLKEYKRAKAKKIDRKVKNDIKRIEKLKNEGEQRPVGEKNIYCRFYRSHISHGRRNAGSRSAVYSEKG